MQSISNAEISGNIISNNGAGRNTYGLYLSSSNNNLIYNNIFNNTNNFYITGTTNSWNTTKTPGSNIIGGNYLGGNYWAKPDGTGFSQTCSSDADGDGICDSPYVLDASNIDYLPLTYDHFPPSVVIISPQNTTYATSTVTINVSATDPSGVSTVIAQIDGTTNITLTYTNGYYVGTTPTLSDGPHYVRIYANDTLGYTNSTETVTFAIDTTPPVIYYTSPTEPDHANVSRNWVYVNVSVSDGVSAVDTCILEFNSTNYTMTFVNTSSDNKTGYCWINLTGLNEGGYSYRVYVNDTAGNLNQTPLRHITLDTTPPVIILSQPVNNSNIDSTTVTFNFTAYDNIDTLIDYTLYIDGVANTTGNATTTLTTVTVTGLTEGTHTWNVAVTDDAGNSNASQTWTFAVDITPPAITFISPTPTNNSIVNTSVTIAVNVTDAISNVSTALINVNGVNYTMSKLGSGKAVDFNYTITSEGTHTYRVYANDSLNHWNSTGTRVVTVDKTPPQITVISYPPSVYRNTKANLTVVIADAHPNKYAVYRNGTFVDSGSYQNGTAFNISINTTSLGYWNYTIKANDTAGNENSSSVIVEVRNNPPVASFTASKTSARTGEAITFNASSSYDSDGSIVSYAWDFGDGSTASGVVVKHSYSSAGTYTVELTVTDSDGATDNATVQITVTSPRRGAGGAGGGGGGATFIPPPFEAPPEIKHVEARYVPAQEEVSFKPSSKIVETADVVEVVIKPKETATVTFAISKVRSLPDEVPEPRYHTYNIFEIGIARYGTAMKIDAEGRIKFRVAKSWLEEKGYAKEQVSLMKYTGDKWIEIPSEITGEDNDYVYYESRLSSFSLFAIVAKPPVVTPETTPSPLPTVSSMGEIPKETQPATSTMITPEKRTPGFDLLAAVAAMTILAILVGRSRS